MLRQLTGAPAVQSSTAVRSAVHASNAAVKYFGWAHTAALLLCSPFCEVVGGQVAAVPCRFDQIRKHQPHLAKHRWQNIFWYGAKAAQTGWLCGGKPLIKHDIHVKVILRASSRHATTFLHLLKGMLWSIDAHSCMDTDSDVEPDWQGTWHQTAKPSLCCSAGCWLVSRLEAVQQLRGARQA